MAVAKVVVASDTPPVKEVIEHGKNGLLFNFFDVQGLAQQVVQVLANRKDYAHLGITARKTVVQRYDLATRCLPALLRMVAD